MREKLKHSKGKWGCVFTLNKSRAVRNKGGIIATIYKPSRYSGQDERYDNELEEARCNQRLIAEAPELLNACIHALEMCEDRVMPTENDLTIMAGRLKAVIEKAIG